MRYGCRVSSLGNVIADFADTFQHADRILRLHADAGNGDTFTVMQVFRELGHVKNALQPHADPAVRNDSEIQTLLDDPLWGYL